MKVLIFGDVHGNLPAMEKVLVKEKNNYDALVCHGDVVNYGPWSNECVNLLLGIKNLTLLLGNHEEYFISGIYPGKNQIAKAFFDHCYPNFDKSLINVIREYKKQKLLEDFTIQHTIYNQYIFADTDISNIEIDTNYIIGHSHQQFEREKHNFKIYNTGSLGQNREFINQSCYLMFDTKKKNIEFKNFRHNIETVINQMKLEKYPSLCLDYYLSKKRI